MRRAYGLGSEGLAFYEFPGIEKPAAYRRSYKARLDGLPLARAQRDAVVVEVEVAFELNRTMFDELHEQREL